MMDIGRCAAEGTVRDCRMVHKIVLLVHDRTCAADEQQRIAVVQLPHLVRCQQLFTIMSSDELKKSVAKRLLVLQRSINLIQFIRLQIRHFVSASLWEIYCNILPILVDSNFRIRTKEGLARRFIALQPIHKPCSHISIGTERNVAVILTAQSANYFWYCIGHGIKTFS